MGNEIKNYAIKCFHRGRYWLETFQPAVCAEDALLLGLRLNPDCVYFGRREGDTSYFTYYSGTSQNYAVVEIND